MLQLRLAVVCALLAGWAAPAGADRYQEAVRRVEQRRARLAERWRGTDDRAALVGPTAAVIQAEVGRLARQWLGTRWGLGAPQTRTPGAGKINCGTFVGTVLRDAGFVVDVEHLQRQPSQLIIASFVGAGRTRKWSNAPMDRFLADLRRMGPGLYIIGLDFHVGFLLQTDDDVRFVHASYLTRTVVDEPAALAQPISDSKYRVVGKILDRGNVRDWLEGNRIRVKGHW
jgi:hypothetical protein